MRTKAIVSVATAVVVAAGAAVVMMNRHQATTPQPAPVRASALTSALPLTDDALARAIVGAGVTVDRLSVRSSGGIVVLRGTADLESAQRAAEVAKTLGAERVANLITQPKPTDDDAIRRDAERQLAATPGLHGTKLSVNCTAGVLVVRGSVQRELQKDLARNVLRAVKAREVKVELTSL